jgi:hypothetical protein
MMAPCVRFTVQWLMVTVAVVAVGLATWIGLERRRARFQRLFIYHRTIAGRATIHNLTPDRPYFESARWHWHHELARKYGRASISPWLPVAPDPPKPE